MSNPEPFDCWQPFKTVNALSPDIPHRGQPRMTQLDDERPPLERHAEQVRAFAVDVVGREPGPDEAAAASKQADALRHWIEQTASDTPDFYEQLEAQVYDVGLLSLWWGLSGDMDALRDFLDFMRKWQDTEAGHPSAVAMGRASKRESAEWHVVAQAIGNMEYQAKQMNSPRLAEAAKVMRAMLTPASLRPEAPAKEARTAGAKKAADARHAPNNTLKARILTECAKLKKGEQWKNPTARKVAPDAYRWNQEAGKPFNWLDVAAAEKQIRRWLDK